MACRIFEEGNREVRFRVENMHRYIETMKPYSLPTAVV